jgi:hypothetical protein
VGARLHRHGATQVVASEFGEFDAEMRRQQSQVMRTRRFYVGFANQIAIFTSNYTAGRRRGAHYLRYFSPMRR